MIDLILRIVAANWFKILCRVALAAVFICAGLGKIAKPADFAEATAGYQLLPDAWVNLFAVTIPWIELVAGVSLLGRPFVEYGATIIAGLNVIFIIALSSAVARHLHIECGCFDSCSMNSTVGWWLILRDAAFILLCIPLLFTTRTGNITSE
jgi:uncharacterized membrane protein YphA (DoxX/SURF4 family)